MPAAFEFKRSSLAGTAFSMTEKSGHTTISQSLKPYRLGHVITVRDAINRQVPLTLFVRHPIARLMSAWSYFYPNMFPNGSGVTRRQPTWEQFVDQVLEGSARNMHWNPAVPMYEGCNIVARYRFEDIFYAWPHHLAPLRHLNKSKGEKPAASAQRYRLRDLHEYFAEDMHVWDNARVF